MNKLANIFIAIAALFGFSVLVWAAFVWHSVLALMVIFALPYVTVDAERGAT